MTDDVPKNGVAARQLWVSIITIVLTMLLSGGAAIWWLGTLSGNVNSLQGTSNTHTEQIRDITAQQQKFDIELAALKAQQIETETQFCASDIVRNLMHANELREIAMLHSAVFHLTYPTDNAYYPTICRRNVGGDN